MSLCYSALTIPWGKHNNMYKLSCRTEWFCQSRRAFKSLQFSVKTELCGGRKTAQRWDRDPHYYCSGGCFVYWGALCLLLSVFLAVFFHQQMMQLQLWVSTDTQVLTFHIGLTVKRKKNYEKSALFNTRGLQHGVRGSRGSSNYSFDWLHTHQTNLNQ